MSDDEEPKVWEVRVSTNMTQVPGSPEPDEAIVNDDGSQTLVFRHELIEDE